ncbi:MAG: hypothetical protein B0D92_08440 [Spirochaeta sp. LUC14_002_19_P3]|nr:MAG: hypothetical protein B0D92_08440 [Spirochaeta sp. LUC14_002_19_P3]
MDLFSFTILISDSFQNSVTFPACRGFIGVENNRGSGFSSFSWMPYSLHLTPFSVTFCRKRRFF